MQLISANFLRLTPRRGARRSRRLSPAQARLVGKSLKADLLRRAKARLQAGPLYSTTDLIDPTESEHPLFSRGPSAARHPAAVHLPAAIPGPAVVSEPAAGPSHRGSPVPTVTAVKPKAAKRLYLHPRFDGVPDILDTIQDLGGIASPKESKFADKGDFDGFSEAMTGPARLLIRRGGSGLMPDLLVSALNDAATSTGQTWKLESTSDLYDAIAAAVSSREADRKAYDRQQLDQQFFEDALTNKPRREGCASPILANRLKVGDKFKVARDKCEVRDLDPETFEIDVRCEPRFGRQKLPDGASIFPDNCRVESKNPMRKPRRNPVQNLRDVSIGDLAFATGHKITKCFRAPSPAGIIQWCHMDGRRMTMKEARQLLEAQYISRRSNPADLFGAPESVADQTARMLAEEAARKKAEQRDELRRRAGAKLVGRGVDTTGDLFDASFADAPLFSTRRKNPSRKSHNRQPATNNPQLTAKRVGKKIIVQRGGKKVCAFSTLARLKKWARRFNYRITRLAAS